MRSAAWLLIALAGAAAAQPVPPAANTEPYRLGKEEAARRLLFCANVYEDITKMHGNPKIRANATANAAKSVERAAKLASGDTHALLARIAKDSFLEQIDGANRAGGAAEHIKALGEFEVDCNRHLERY